MLPFWLMAFVKMEKIVYGKGKQIKLDQKDYQK